MIAHGLGHEVFTGRRGDTVRVDGRKLPSKAALGIIQTQPEGFHDRPGPRLGRPFLLNSAILKMSAIEETKTEVRVPKQPTAAVESASLITRALNLLSSVKFGVSLLVLLAAACMVGMLIVQQNV